MIYFDNSATTEPNEEVLATFVEVSKRYYGNASSAHQLGLNAEQLLRKSYQHISRLLSVKPTEIIYTSGGTEGNNLAIKGIALAYQSRGKHLITTSIEHPSVLNPFKALEELGFEVTYLPVDQSGIVSVDDLKQALRDDTILVSVMHVNNELGTIQPIRAIGEVLKNRKYTFFHVDNVQGFGKVELDLKASYVDLATISGHKIHGLKGTGLLYQREGVRLFPLLHGGGQQDNRHSGTEDIAGIVSLARAMRLILEKQTNQVIQLRQLNQLLRERLNEIEDVVINTPEDQAPHIINFSIPGFKPEIILHALEERGIYVSTQSACSSKKADESSVLRAIHLPPNQRNSALRISFSYQNTPDQVDKFVQSLKAIITELKQDMR
ncbi:cysteine desulfurase family protein [Amphibacillus xylanus]|uniref:Cysteine desulfurase n=1 Tax=Amphibacillus xylanus (strain ATCC 51415 / DSM 6626 / JCM 7361 / LMG 17667 / NBRC 15112 / Ep01) TaxID=698758 RepID=K0J378_AMPXN|nr:cysteine desulfurase family protein [Amphibacillus xylanus]BAM47046.1 cysteine desulfurase [Amphibacillus xylanus NBRC 15112]